MSVGPSFGGAPYRTSLATDERSRPESVIAIPGTGDHDGSEYAPGSPHSHVYRRRGKPEASVYCHRFDRNVPPDIVRCSEFESVAALTLGQRRETALAIDPRRGIGDGSYR